MRIQSWTVLLVATLATSHVHAEKLRKVLTDSDQNINVPKWIEDGRSSDGTTWWVEKETLHGGKQEGVELITINNGKLELSIIPTRGLGVYRVDMGDVRLGWDSPVKEIVHPHFMDLGSRGGLGWLDGFNEYMCRCGLEFAGGPGEDKFINNQGNEATMDLTLHGKIANIPASHVEVVVDDDGRIHVRGRVYERLFFGPNLELQVDISTLPGSNEFRIADKVINHSAAQQEFIMIYHANHGRPLLEQGSRLVAPVKRVFPINDHAARAIDTYTEFKGPIDGFVEEVFCIYPYSDRHGKTEVMLHNAAGDKGVSLKYSVDELPHLTLWKNTLSEANGYVTGVEPGTSFPNNRRIERKAGRLAVLEPSQTRPFTVNFVIHDSRPTITAAADRIRQIQNGRPTQVDEQPE